MCAACALGYGVPPMGLGLVLGLAVTVGFVLGVLALLAIFVLIVYVLWNYH